MILVDSNILVYAINADSPKNLNAKSFIQKNRNFLCIAQQNIFETLRILTHSKFPYPMPSDLAIEAISAISDNLQMVIAPSTETKFIAFEMIKKYRLNSDFIFDAYLAATALTNEVLEIATDNTKDFRIFEEIKVINPFI